VDAGLVPQQASIWIVEGLFYYLEAAAVHHVLAEISAIAAPGSVLVTDLVSASFLASPWMKPFLQAMEERGMAWRFGTDDPAGLFGGFGWEARASQPDEEASRFDPRRFPRTNSRPPVGGGGFFVVARQPS